MHHVIQPPFHDRQQHFAGVFRGARGELEITAELPLEDAVEAFQLLFLAQTDAVLAGFATAVTVHPRRDVAALDGALGAVATAALEVQLDAFPAAQLANGIKMTSHGLKPKNQMSNFKTQTNDKFQTIQIQKNQPSSLGL